MAFQHGKEITFSIDNSGGSPTSISAYVTDVDFPQTVDTADVTPVGATGDRKQYVVGLLDSNLTVNANWDPTLDALIDGILGQAAGTFDYSPDNGTTSYTGEAFCVGYSQGGGTGGANTVTINFQVTGDVTRA